MVIFARSSFGKSMLLSMLALYAAADVNVIRLIGQHGREVQEFIYEYIGEEDLAKSIVVVAISDEAPLARRQAAYLTLDIAEHFRDQGKDALCMIDSVTRFAMAQREIRLAAGESPTTIGSRSRRDVLGYTISALAHAVAEADAAVLEGFRSLKQLEEAAKTHREAIAAEFDRRERA